MLQFILTLGYVLPVLACLFSLVYIDLTRPDAFNSLPELFQAEFTPHRQEFTRKFITGLFAAGALSPVANWVLLALLLEWLAEPVEAGQAVEVTE